MTLTFNYSWFYYQFIDEDDGLRWLDGKIAAQTRSRLEEAIEELGTDEWERGEGYWAPTPGNAGSALQTLLQWANRHPEATWEIA